jgi:hypothetical protein
MRPIHIPALLLLVLGASGCVSEPAPHADADDRAIASVVALLSGYESDGLVSTLGELLADSLAREEEPPFAIHASRVEEPPRVRTLVTSRSGVIALGESRLRFTVENAGIREHGAGEAVALDVDGESLHASASLAIRARSSGSIFLAAAGPLRDRASAGELRIDGALGDHPTNGVPFNRIEATLSWSRLRLTHGAERELPSVAGVLSISIAARGERGLVLRNGILVLDGTDRGILDLGGRRYAIDIRRAHATQ